MSPINKSYETLPESQAMFVQALEQLTSTGRACWVQSEVKPGHVRCRIGDELIEFETFGGESSHEPVSPDGSIDAIISRFRNIVYLYLLPQADAAQLLSLIRHAPADHLRYVQVKREMLHLPADILKALVSLPA